MLLQMQYLCIIYVYISICVLYNHPLFLFLLVSWSPWNYLLQDTLCSPSSVIIWHQDSMIEAKRFRRYPRTELNKIGRFLAGKPKQKKIVLYGIKKVRIIFNTTCQKPISRFSVSYRIYCREELKEEKTIVANVY